MDIKKFFVILIFLIYNAAGFSRGGRITGMQLMTTKLFTNECFFFEGGQAAVEGQFPFQCAIYVYTNSEKGTTFCSGSIISANFVLSAAHCFEIMTSGILIAGVNNLQDEDPPYDWDFDVTNVKMHEYYNSSTLVNDIAVINASENPFEFSKEKISKIELRSLNLYELVGKSAQIAGW